MARLTGMTRLLAAAAAFAAMTVHADCAVRSGPHVRALVELYTSEGCSSCPPADRWLSKLAASGDHRVVPLAFHVSYWDYIGWKDRFASARYTERQHDLAEATGASMVYTPQVMIGGRDFRGWSSESSVNEAIDAIARGAAPATLALASKPATAQGIEGTAAIEWPGGKPAANAMLYVALTQDGLGSHVTAGENKGEDLRHHAVIRDFTPLGSRDGKFSFAAKPDWDLAHMSLVAFAQDPRTGRVLQALSAPVCR